MFPICLLPVPQVAHSFLKLHTRSPSYTLAPPNIISHLRLLPPKLATGLLETSVPCRSDAVSESESMEGGMVVVEAVEPESLEIDRSPSIEVTYVTNAPGPSLDDVRQLNRGKGKAVDEGSLFAEGDATSTTSSEIELQDQDGEDEEVDWTKYDPPQALSKTPNVTSEILLEVVESSIQNVKNQIIIEEQARKEQEEEARAAEGSGGSGRRYEKCRVVGAGATG